MAHRAILHLDMDSFFVSVERVRDPSLVGKPVVVGGSPEGRGVVASASYESRLYGVHAAMPMAEALRRCPHLTIVGGGFGDYVKVSRQVRAILDRFVPVVEQSSIDEFYGDLTGTGRLLGSPADRLKRLLEAIRTETGLPCSGVLATNKLVAKVATKWAKPNGMWVIAPGTEAAIFAPLPIEALPGIGPVTKAKLERAGIYTLGDLAALPKLQAEALFGRLGSTLASRARGEDDSHVVPSSDAKSIGHETTFPQDIEDLEALRAIVWELAARVGYKLRQEGLLARTITLKLRKGDFQTYTRSRTLPTGTAGDYAIARVAEDLLGSVHKPGMPVRLAGVRATGLLTAHEQRLLFEATQQDQVRSYYATLDAIRDRFGFGAIGSGLTAAARRGDTRPEGTAPEGSLFALSSKQSLQRIVEGQVKREEREQGWRETGERIPVPV